jgi:hypothetical protein
MVSFLLLCLQRKSNFNWHSLEVKSSRKSFMFHLDLMIPSNWTSLDHRFIFYLSLSQIGKISFTCCLGLVHMSTLKLITVA